MTSARDGKLALPPEAAGTRWLDGLQLSGAQELAHYQHPHFGPVCRTGLVLVENGRPVLRAECRLCGYAGPFGIDDVGGDW